jgi:hypothetical protein
MPKIRPTTQTTACCDPLIYNFTMDGTCASSINNISDVANFFNVPTEWITFFEKVGGQVRFHIDRDFDMSSCIIGAGCSINDVHGHINKLKGVPTPEMTTNVSSLNNFAKNACNNSAPQSILVNGSDLGVGNRTVSVTTGWEVSLDGTTWTSSVNILPINGNIVNKQLFVRMSGTATTGTLTAGIAPSVALSGSITSPQVSISPVSLNIRKSNPNESASQTMQVSGVDLDDDVVVSATSITGGITNVLEFSLNGTTWSESVTIPKPANGTLPSTNVFVRIPKRSQANYPILAQNSEYIEFSENATVSAVTNDCLTNPIQDDSSVDVLFEPINHFIFKNTTGLNVPTLADFASIIGKTINTGVIQAESSSPFTHIYFDNQNYNMNGNREFNPVSGNTYPASGLLISDNLVIVKSQVEIMTNFTFAEQTELSQVFLEKLVRCGGQNFINCSNLSKVVFGTPLTNLGSSTGDDDIFTGCTNIFDITIPSALSTDGDVTAAQTINPLLILNLL